MRAYTRLQYSRESARLAQLFITSCVVAASGCNGDATRGPGLVERDSAGVVIVESLRPSWTSSEEWRVARTPSVRIGTAEGDKNFELFRVGGVDRLSSGEIIVVNGGSDEIRIFSATGDYIRTIGRSGSGPGELNAPTSVWVLADDTIIVDDFVGVSVFTADGKFVHPVARGPWTVQDVYPDGTYLQVLIPAGQDAFQAGYSRPLEALVRRSRDGSGADTLAVMLGDEMFRSVSDAGGVSSFAAPFGATRLAAVSGSKTFTGDGSAAEVLELDELGRLGRVIRWDVQPVRVTAASIDSLESVMLGRARTDLQRQRRQRLFREWTYPAQRPVYDRLLVDSERHLWVRHHNIAAQQSMWSVIDSTGRWLGVVDVPAALEVRTIDRDFIMGVGIDSLGVESVQLYTIVKP